jgi:hypothetical protein
MTGSSRASSSLAESVIRFADTQQGNAGKITEVAFKKCSREGHKAVCGVGKRNVSYTVAARGGGEANAD